MDTEETLESEELETTEEEVEEAEEEEGGEGEGSNESSAETPEEKATRLEKENADLTTKNKQLFERAKKNQGKGNGPVVLTPKDALILAKADVHEEDLDEVLEYAGYKKISVADALKDKTLKNILDTKSEERRTAAATQTGGGARGQGAKVSGEDILRKAESTGEVPDTSEGMQSLFLARQARKTNRNPKK